MAHGSLLYSLTLEAPKEKIVSTNTISTAMFGHSAQMRGAFYGMKTFFQRKTKEVFDMAPAKLNEPVYEVCTVLPPRGTIDPVNYHPIEKVMVDVLIKNGFLPDDNWHFIPFVTFQSRTHAFTPLWAISLDFYRLSKEEKEELDRMEGRLA